MKMAAEAAAAKLKPKPPKTQTILDKTGTKMRLGWFLLFFYFIDNAVLVTSFKLVEKLGEGQNKKSCGEISTCV